MLLFFKELGRCNIQETSYNGYENLSDYYYHLQSMQRECEIEIEYHLSSYQGTESKRQYLLGLLDTIECTKYNISGTIVSTLRGICTPKPDDTKKYKDPKYAEYAVYADYYKSEYTDPTHPDHNKYLLYQEYIQYEFYRKRKKRIPITIADDRLPSLSDLDNMERIMERNETQGYEGMSSEDYMIYTYIQIHIHRIEDITYYISQTISRIERGERYTPIVRPSNLPKRLEIELVLEGKYPNGIMSRKDVIDLLQINPSTMTRYSNIGYITPIDPTSKIHYYTIPSVVQLYNRVKTKAKK